MIGCERLKLPTENGSEKILANGAFCLLELPEYAPTA